MSTPNPKLTAEWWENAEPPHPIYGPPRHPGAVIKEEFLEPLGVSINQMAGDLGITYRRAHEIVSGKRGISAETALLLAKYFRMSPQFWLGLQADYDLEVLRGQMKEKMSRVRVLPRPDIEASSETTTKRQEAAKIAVPAERAGIVETRAKAPRRKSSK